MAIEHVRYPVIEVHVSNPSRRGVISDVSKVCDGTVTGLGVEGCRLAILGLHAFAEWANNGL